jgi:hypothetical protein
MFYIQLFLPQVGAAQFFCFQGNGFFTNLNGTKRTYIINNMEKESTDIMKMEIKVG